MQIKQERPFLPTGLTGLIVSGEEFYQAKNPVYPVDPVWKNGMDTDCIRKKSGQD